VAVNALAWVRFFRLGGWKAMAFDRLTDCDADLADVLLPGTSLLHGQYRIASFLNSGGFGITYLARDRLRRDIVLKECFVPAFCQRSQTSVLPRSDSSKAHLQKAIRGFLAEAQTLATLSHPNIVRVHQVFEENNTAYMALDYVKGHDLLEIVDEKKATLSPDQIVAIARKMISAMGHIHDQHLLHCDISPDNICIRTDGEPVLIDFGSAREIGPVTGPRETGFSMVKDGYSPHEFYTTNGIRGQWSDVYALGASLYHAISGACPVDCQSRISSVVEGLPDPVKPLAGTLPGYPSGFLASIDNAINLQSSARHQSAQDWLRAIAPPQITANRNVALLRRVMVSPGAALQVAGGAK